MKIVVIGADQGLGEKLCGIIRQKGQQAAAGMYRIENAKNSGAEDGHLLLLTDVTDPDSLQRAADVIRYSWGRADAVVDVAGVLTDGDRTHNLMDIDLQDVRTELEVNAIGVLSAFRAFYPVLNKNGRFVAVTSEGGSFSNKGDMFPSYGISKTAANKIVQILRETVKDVEIMAVHPGRMNTEMGRTTAEIEPEEAAEGIYRIVAGETRLREGLWFIDYKGCEMPL